MQVNLMDEHIKNTRDKKKYRHNGNWYLYPVRGGRPFANTFMTMVLPSLP